MNIYEIESRIDEYLISNFEKFIVNEIPNSEEFQQNSNYTVNYLKKHIFPNIFKKYPASNNIFKADLERVNNLIQQAIYCFNRKHIEIQENIANNHSPKITNIDLGLGDFHKGLSTTLVHLEDGEKIIFKPTCPNISESFFEFMDYLSEYYDLGDFKYNFVKVENYQWLQFVKNIPCNSIAEIKVYYERAGFMLGVLYVLNAVDFHYENVIAHGDTPVLIDHETIIQPKINSNIQKYFKTFLKEEIEDSVIHTMLLPNHYETVNSMPKGTCGYGYHKQKSVQIIKKEVVNRFTGDWKFLPKFVEQSFQKENLPTLNGKAIYPNEYIEELLNGFEKSYYLFMNKKTFLLSDKNSPLYAFKDKTVRFIWRATNVYAKIFNQMKLPKNLTSYEHYEQKIKDYLALAFKNVPKDSELMFIYKQEVAEMLRGDIPFFEANSSSRDLHTEFGVIKNFFELSAVENIERKLIKLSHQDLDIQKRIILESFI